MDKFASWRFIDSVPSGLSVSLRGGLNRGCISTVLQEPLFLGSPDSRPEGSWGQRRLGKRENLGGESSRRA